MKKIKLSSYALQFVVLIFILLLFTECKNNAEFEKDVNTFFATFFFVIFMVIGGIPSIIFSAINVKSTKSAIKVLAIVFISIFGFFSIIAILMYSKFWTKGAKDWIGMLAVIQFGSMALSIILIALGASNKAKIVQVIPKPVPRPKPTAPKKPAGEIDYMDEILKD